jgi:hypothetical protein
VDVTEQETIVRPHNEQGSPIIKSNIVDIIEENTKDANDV